MSNIVPNFSLGAGIIYQSMSKHRQIDFENLKYSVGGGVRLLLSSLVLRADYATGAEGGELTAIIGYGF